jgi:phage protein U
MAITKSFQQYGTMPSAILSDGILTIPLWAVTTMTLTESYHLPPIGSTGSKSVIGTHDDSITLAGVLVGAERYIWKVGLETLAESSRRGSALASFTGGAAGGLVLVTSMTIRTDMHVTSLTFTASAARRDALDVSLGMAHLPLPSALGTLLDAASVGVGALADLGGN